MKKQRRLSKNEKAIQRLRDEQARRREAQRAARAQYGHDAGFSSSNKVQGEDYAVKKKSNVTVRT